MRKGYDPYVEYYRSFFAIFWAITAIFMFTDLVYQNWYNQLVEDSVFTGEYVSTGLFFLYYMYSLSFIAGDSEPYKPLMY